MFMRLSWPKADDAGVVEFMFFFGLNVSPAGLTPLENICDIANEWQANTNRRREPTE
jgi:hypothetical protein